MPSKIGNISFDSLSTAFVILGVISFLIILLDIKKHPQKEMPIMNYVWPINGLWGSIFVLWAYFTIGKHRKMDMSGMKMDMDMKMDDMGNMKMDKDCHMDMSDMKMEKEMPNEYSAFWQGVIADTLHCGAGCSLADLVGPWIFLIIPFTLFGQLTYGEWVVDFILALVIGATFQYGAISPMLNKKGKDVWLKALKIDFLSLTAWQIGMYGWMGFATFYLFGRFTPFDMEFWFMMQIAMCCGFITSYPMNWILVKLGIKMGM